MRWPHGAATAALPSLLKRDPEVGRYLDPQTIDGLFDTAYHFKHVDTIFDRVFGQQA